MGVVNQASLCLYGGKTEESCRLTGKNRFNRLLSAPRAMLFNTECVGVDLLTRLLKWPNWEESMS